MNYSTAQAMLSGRNSKKIDNNTHLKQLEDCIAVLYHETYIVKFYDKFAVYDNGGWYSMTTKDRLNKYGVDGVTIHQKNNLWYFNDNSVYYNGVKIRYTGQVIRPRQPAKTEDQSKKLKAKIKKYVDGYIKCIEAGQLGFPDRGDCWGCYMVDKAGNTVMGDSHLWDHIKENYFVPSLLVNAGREAGYKDFQIGLMGIGGQRVFITPDKILTKYLYKHLR